MLFQARKRFRFALTYPLQARQPYILPTHSHRVDSQLTNRNQLSSIWTPKYGNITVCVMHASRAENRITHTDIMIILRPQLGDISLAETLWALFSVQINCLVGTRNDAGVDNF